MASGTAPNVSAVLTEQELEFIKRRFNGSKSAAIHKGLTNMMIEEITITVGTIETRPEHDPYVNMSGTPSRTVLNFDTETGEISVEQEYRTNSTSMRRWHQIDLAASFQVHPKETAVRRFIDDNMDLFKEVKLGADTRWDGSNWTGTMTEDARDAWETLSCRIAEEWFGENEQYQFWAVEDWLQHADLGITAETTDEELAELAKAIESDAEADGIILDDSPLQYLTNERNELRDEEE
jgi:hypothetical protein